MNVDVQVYLLIKILDLLLLFAPIYLLLNFLEILFHHRFNLLVLKAKIFYDRGISLRHLGGVSLNILLLCQGKVLGVKLVLILAFCATSNMLS